MGRLILMLHCILLNGCTILKIDGATPAVKYYFGVANISLEEDKKSPLVLTSNSFGLIKTPNAISIGYAKEFLSKFPDPSLCNMLVIVETVTELNSLKKMIQDSPSEINSLCITSKDGYSWAHQKITHSY